MPDSSTRQTVKPLIQEVLDVRRWDRLEPDFRFEGLSRHGYVLQCTLVGCCQHTSGGRGYELRRGSVVWLDDLERHTCEVREAPWVFYSIQFTAPALIKPEPEDCVRHVNNETIDRFVRLLDIWQDKSVFPAVRAMRVHAMVSNILADITATSKALPHTVNEQTKPWWDLEAQIRHQLDKPIQLSDLEAMSGINRTSLTQLARTATGTSPMKRVKQLRITHAACLLVGSSILIKEVAAAVGYPRVHEFSRDFKQLAGVSPRAFRARDILIEPVDNRKGK